MAMIYNKKPPNGGFLFFFNFKIANKALATINEIDY